MKTLQVLFVLAVLLGVVAPSLAVKSHPMTDKLLSSFGRAFLGEEQGKEFATSSKGICLGCTLGTYNIQRL